MSVASAMWSFLPWVGQVGTEVGRCLRRHRGTRPGASSAPTSRALMGGNRAGDYGWALKTCQVMACVTARKSETPVTLVTRSGTSPLLDPFRSASISSRHLSDRPDSDPLGGRSNAVSPVPARQSRARQVLPGMRGTSGTDLHEVSSRVARIGEVLLGVWGAGWPADPGPGSRILYAKAPRRE